MGAKLYNKFQGGMGLRLIKASWLNKIANLWNYAQGGNFINCNVPEDPSPDRGPRWDLDVNALDSELEMRGFAKNSSSVKLAPISVDTENEEEDDDELEQILGFAPEPPADPILSQGRETDSSKMSRIGTSSRAARSDHRHPMVNYPASKIRVKTGTLEGEDYFKTLQQMYDQGELGGSEGTGIQAPSEYTGSSSSNIVSWVPGSNGSAGFLIYTNKISKNAIADLDLDQYVTSDALAEYAKTSDLSGYAKTTEVQSEINSALSGINIPEPGTIAELVKSELVSDVEGIKDSIMQAAEEAAQQAASDTIEGYTSQLGDKIDDALSAATELEDKLSYYSNVDALIEQFNQGTSLDNYLTKTDAESTYATKEEVDGFVTDEVLADELLGYLRVDDEISADDIIYANGVTVGDVLDDTMEDLYGEGNTPPFSGTLTLCTEIKSEYSAVAGGNILKFKTEDVVFRNGRIISRSNPKSWDDYSV